ncbi:TetR/AcrR family transcriptional regulator [Kribbella sp. NPDC050124]|uniref:TetR/AcrR family transcriptional regulator n=1 Tax=Kribbella sp. NPDC050124 TaxID=3364114 RepID=UPI0037A5D553
MPRLWSETIDEHRRAVREATLDATAELIAHHGLTSVTMSQIAATTGIGRATLYKYFPDVESIVAAWHERLITTHLEQLRVVREQARTPQDALHAVLQTYALNTLHQHTLEGAATLHRLEHVADARQHLRDFLADLLTEGARAGQVRADIPPNELAEFCLHALSAAGDLHSKAAVARLVTLIQGGLTPH